MTEPIRILLVDDSPYFLEAARDFLQHQEAISVAGVATNAEEAIARARELQPDIILLDLNLARSSGLNLIPVFKGNLPGAKIVVLTMMEASSYRAAALQAGADDFVPKNNMGSTLITVIHGLMGRAEPAATPGQAEESKRLDEGFYQSVLEDISELIIRFLPDGTLTYVNDAYCRYYGKSREELIGSNFISSAADDFPQKLREHLESFTPERPVIAFEQYDILPNGEKRWREWVDRAFFDRDGRVLEFQSTGRDITAHKRAEEALRESEERFRTLVNSTNDVVFTLDREQRHTGVFGGWVEKAGLTPEFFLGKTVREIFGEQAAPIHEAANRRALDGEDVVYEWSAPGPNGLQYYQTSLSPLRASNGTISGIVGIGRDITARKRAEEELRVAEEKYRTHVERLPAITYIDELDGRGTTLFVSPQIEAYLGVTVEEWINSDNSIWTDMIHPEDRERVLPVYLGAEEAREPYNLEYRMIARDGRIIWFRDQGMILKPGPGEHSVLHGIMYDITEHKRVETELGESQAQLAGVIHSTMDALITIDEDHRITLFNPAAEQMFKCPASEAVGSPLDRFIPASARGKHRGFVRAYGRSGQTRRMMQISTLDLNCLRADGTTFPGEISISQFEARGRKTFIASVRDVTERKQAEATLRESEDRYRDLVEHIHDLIGTHDLEGNILSINQAATELLGIEADALLKMNLRDILTPEARDEFDAYLAAIRRDGKASGLMLVRTKSGEERVWEYDNTLRTEAIDRPIVRALARDITERRRAEKALREGERRYRQLFEANPHPMWVYDLESLRFLAVNDAAVIHYGYSREEFLGMTLLDIRPPEDRARLLDNVAAVTEGLDEAGDWRHVKKDGGVIDVEITSHTLEFDGRRAEVILVNDITARKQAEERLAASEAELRALFAAMRDVVLIIDRDGVYRKIAPTDPGLLYRPPEELLGKSLQDVFPLEEAEKFLAALRRVLETKQIEQVEYELAINGRRVWFNAAITPMSGDMTVWVARDITARKRAEERVQNQLDRLSALREIDLAITSTFDMRVSLDVLLSQTVKYLSVDAASILLVDASTAALKYEAGIGFRTHAPRSANVKLGESYAGKAALERRLVRIPNLADEPENLLLTAHLKGEDFVSYHAMPLIVKGKVLGVLEVFNRSAVKRDDEWYDFFGSLAGQAAIAVDNAQLFSASQRELTERRRAEEELLKLNAELEERVEDRTTDLKRLNLELERAVRVKDEFLANMSHELRTPLNAIIGLSESLAEKTVGELNEKQAKYVSVIAESGQHLLELINDILDLAKIEAGQVRLDRNKVNVSAVCQSGLRMIHQLAHRKNQEVSFEMDDGLDLIRADERRLKQMLVNLLSNAVKFTPEGGRLGLEVRGNRRANIVQFTVWDTGIGIEAEDLERLFRPFVQLDSELSRTTTGTGLGLALVAQMARLHGGSVSVESQPGKGSRFTITLPWETAANTGSLPGRTTEGLSAGKPGTERARRTILLVEDTEDVIILIGDYLEHAGYKVESARNGLDGIAQARKARPDLILMDIQMPDMDGLEATRQLRAEGGFERTPIIALTALAMPGDRERALAAGMDEYISKPVNLKSMLKIIQRFLAGDENPGG